MAISIVGDTFPPIDLNTAIVLGDIAQALARCQTIARKAGGYEYYGRVVGFSDDDARIIDIRAKSMHVQLLTGEYMDWPVMMIMDEYMEGRIAFNYLEPVLR